MTVPVFTHDQFLDYIKSYGWEVKSTDYWDEYNRLILEKQGIRKILLKKGQSIR